MWAFFNPNPCGIRNSDCAIRAVSKVTGMDWETVYINLCALGFALCDLPNADRVWGTFLQERGFRRYALHDCPECVTVRKFARLYPKGTYVLATGSHAVAVVNGVYYDAWDSGDQIPLYYYH